MNIIRKTICCVFIITVPSLQAQEPCGSYFNPCNVKIQPQNNNSANSFKSFDYGATMEQANRSNNLLLQNMLMLQQLKQQNQKSLISDWVQGYREGEANGLTKGIRQLSEAIYNSSPEELEQFKRDYKNAFPDESNIYQMIGDLIEIRLSQLAGNN